MSLLGTKAERRPTIIRQEFLLCTAWPRGEKQERVFKAEFFSNPLQAPTSPERLVHDQEIAAEESILISIQRSANTLLTIAMGLRVVLPDEFWISQREDNVVNR